MKKVVCLLMLAPFFCLAQKYPLPSYPSLLNEFFSKYSFSSMEAVDGLNFAKEKDGWHVQIIDRVTEVVKSDQLYWSAKNGFYLLLSGFDTTLNVFEKEKQISTYLSGDVTYNFYGYERCQYYGYSQWSEDMMRDFGNGSKENYSDTLLEGLAKAYSAYASKFLWYQYGGQVEEKDSLKTKLAPLELPSQKRIDSVYYYIQKAIETYKLLADKNNSYQMLVGNSGMKLFNEQMNGYMHLSMAGYNSLAKAFINDISPNKTITAIARNYLNACAPNAILFTSGDNDTYPLWYVQERENFRKDVTVLNTNLLGLPAYIHMIDRKKVVSFSTPSSVYGDSSFLYFLQKEDTEPKSCSLPTFIKNIHNKKFVTSSEVYGPLASYPEKEIILTVDLNKFKKISSQSNLKSQIKISPGNYILNDQFMMLDIVNSNLYTRPIYFSWGSDLLSNYLQREGSVMQFLPLDNTKEKLTQKISFQKTRDYLKRYTVISSTDLSSGISASDRLDQEACYLYALVADYYISINRLDSAAVILGKLLNKYNNKLPVTFDQTALGVSLIKAAYLLEGRNLMEDCAVFMYQLYKTPSARYAFVSAEQIVKIITGMQYYLKLTNLQSEKINNLITSFGGE